MKWRNGGSSKMSLGGEEYKVKTNYAYVGGSGRFDMRRPDQLFLIPSRINFSIKKKQQHMMSII